MKKKNQFENPAIDKMTPSQKPFSKINFILIGCCCLLIIIGFLLMLGGGSSIETGFNPDIFSTRRIVVGPLLAFLGFLLMAFAILVDPNTTLKKLFKKKEKAESETVIVKSAEDEQETMIRK